MTDTFGGNDFPYEQYFRVAIQGLMVKLIAPFLEDSRYIENNVSEPDDLVMISIELSSPGIFKLSTNGVDGEVHPELSRNPELFVASMAEFLSKPTLSNQEYWRNILIQKYKDSCPIIVEMSFKTISQFGLGLYFYDIRSREFVYYNCG